MFSLGSLIKLIEIAYYSYDYCQTQLGEALNDKDHFARQMVDAFVEMVQELYDGNYGASSSHHGGFVVGKRGNIDGERVLDIKNS